MSYQPMQLPNRSLTSSALKWTLGLILAAGAVWAAATWLVLGLAYIGWIG